MERKDPEPPLQESSRATDCPTSTLDRSVRGVASTSGDEIAQNSRGADVADNPKVSWKVKEMFITEGPRNVQKMTRLWVPPQAADGTPFQR
jgi:hypothetical protein